MKYFFQNFHAESFVLFFTIDFSLLIFSSCLCFTVKLSLLIRIPLHEKLIVRVLASSTTIEALVSDVIMMDMRKIVTKFISLEKWFDPLEFHGDLIVFNRFSSPPDTYEWP